MSAIDWAGFSWQVFATLVTGFAAVVGAIFIGLRQHSLMKEQARLSARQTQIAESAALITRLKLRADLFERRMKVYEATQIYLRAALSPNRDKIWDATPELDRQLVRAKFLFSNDVTSQLDTAISLADDLHNKKYERDEIRDRDEDATEISNEIRRMRREQRENISKLADTLGEEMKLYEERQAPQ